MKLRALWFILLLASSSTRADDGDFRCEGKILDHFPVTRLRDVFGLNVIENETTDAGISGCAYHFRKYGPPYRMELGPNGEYKNLNVTMNDPGAGRDILLHDTVKVEYVLYESEKHAAEALEWSIGPQGYAGVQSVARLRIGDSAVFIVTNQSLPFILIARHGSLVLKVFGNPPFATREKLEALMKLAVTPGQRQPPVLEPVPSPSPTEREEEEGAPLIHSLRIEDVDHPDLHLYQVMAGEPTFPPNGFVRFVDNEVKLSIGGIRFSGAQLSCDAIGVYNRDPCIVKFKNVTVTDTRIEAVMVVPGDTMAGGFFLKITNGLGKVAMSEIIVLHTGTQYLRYNVKGVEFYGHWPEVDQRVSQIARLTTEAQVRVLSKSSFKQLHLLFFIYERGIWKKEFAKKICGIEWAGGCAHDNKGVIYLVEPGNSLDTLAGVAHESTHFLQMYYDGNARWLRNVIGAPAPFPRPGEFTTKWKQTQGTVNLQTCPLLPVAPPNWSWKDGTFKPACGMMVPYGAMGLLERGNTYEDVATQNDTYWAHVSRLKDPEISKDPRFEAKRKLLGEYDFLP